MTVTTPPPDREVVTDTDAGITRSCRDLARTDRLVPGTPAAWRDRRPTADLDRP